MSRFKHIWKHWYTPHNEMPPYFGPDLRIVKDFLTQTNKRNTMGKVISLNYTRLPVRLIVAQTDGRLGVENAKIIITVVTTFFVDLLQIIKNKDYINLVSLLFNLIKQGNIIAVAKTAWEEVKDASLEETNDLHRHFAQVLDIEDDQAEELIERAFGLIPEAYELALKGLSLYGDVRSFFTEISTIFKNGEVDVVEVDTSLLLAA